MDQRQIGMVILGIGVVAILLSLLADAIGIGGADTFGWKQATLLGVGIVLSVGGGVVLMREAEEPGEPREEPGEPGE